MGLVLKELKVEDFEKVIEVIDESCGLRAIIAIHDTTLGPGLGGIRFYPYKTFDEALTDVTRLARGMTHKAAMSKLGLGGAKAVVIVNPEQKTEAQLRSFAQAVNQLEGMYICAADYGCTLEDIKTIRKTTRYVVGVPSEKGSGDPSPYTAWGTIVSMKFALNKLFGTSDFHGRTVAIQGLGSVGYRIAEHLYWMGARLIVADPCTKKTQMAEKKLGAMVVSVEDILKVECDILSPCALGGIINAKTIPTFNCLAIVGCANNQLLTDQDAELLNERNIMYATDFVVNAGGLINVSFELQPDGYDPVASRTKIEDIYTTLSEIYDFAKINKWIPQRAVFELIEHKLKNKIGKRSEPLFFHEMVEI